MHTVQGHCYRAPLHSLCTASDERVLDIMVWWVGAIGRGGHTWFRRDKEADQSCVGSKGKGRDRHGGEESICIINREQDINNVTHGRYITVYRSGIGTDQRLRRNGKGIKLHHAYDIIISKTKRPMGRHCLR